MSLSTTKEILNFYASPGVNTDAGELSPMFANPPAELASLVQIVQGALLHVFWAERYGRTLSEVEKAPLNIRPVAEKLTIMAAIDPAPLTSARPLELRQVGNCRDFSVLLCALLRYQGIPARARCGFGTYFLPNRFEDHWICETWSSA
jgi:hypothetical protein